jgi:hypothetical protein
VNDGFECFRGKYFHIAGSANAKTASDLILYAHHLVSEMTARIVESGGGLVLFAGKEPRQNDEDPNSPALIFDWTALDTISKVLEKRSSVGLTNPVVIVVLSEKAESEIPGHRRQLWDGLLKSGLLRVEYIKPGARSGAMIRDHQVQHGDFFICLGGGTGVEHLAEMYLLRRKTVIPLDLQLGSSREDGTGGSERLYREARATPSDFVRLRVEEQSRAAALLTLLSSKSGATDVTEIMANLAKLVSAIKRPIAFYVRILNPRLPDYSDVEKFFRNVVDPITDAFCYEKVEMGTSAPEHPFMDVEIFETLHYSDMVVADVTGQRPNCFIELGYALGRGRRVIITAKEGTALPFDQQAIPCFFWNPATEIAEVQRTFKAFIEKNLNRPRVVE